MREKNFQVATKQCILHCSQACLKLSNQDCVYGDFIYKQELY